MRTTIIKWFAIGVLALGIVYGTAVTIKNRVGTKELSTTKPLATGLATEVKVIPVVTVKKSSSESRLRVVLPEGHSVTASADLKPSETGYGVVTVIDENTGVSTIQKYEKPQSAFGLPMTGRIKAGYGISTLGHQTGKVGLELTPLRIGSVYVSAEAELRFNAVTKPEAYVGALAEYRFDLL